MDERRAGVRDRGELGDELRAEIDRPSSTAFVEPAAGARRLTPCSPAGDVFASDHFGVVADLRT